MSALLFEFVVNVIAVFHAAVLAIYVAGGVAVLRGEFFRGPLKVWHRGYLTIVFLMSVSVLISDRCCLTRLENKVRSWQTPQATYECSFLEHYVPQLSRTVDTVGSLVFLLLGCVAVLAALSTWMLSALHRSPLVSHKEP
jgi:putative Ca2+/H+ antiporter (TMEM165/GDT1 family)